MLSPPAVAGEERLEERRRLSPHPLVRVESAYGLLLGPPAPRSELGFERLRIELEVDRRIWKREEILLENRLGDENVAERRRGYALHDRGDGVLMQEHVVEEGDIDG